MLATVALALFGHPVHSNDHHSLAPTNILARRSHRAWASDASVCKDFDVECPEAAARGACATEAEFMRANCRSSCELCSTTKKLPKKEPPSPSFPECKRMTVGGAGGVGATGKMRGRRTYCSERYSEDLVCKGHTFDFTRLERGRDSWDIIEREVSSAKGDLGDGEPRVVFQGPNVSEASHNTAFLCNDDGTVSTYGGRIKATSRFATAHSQNFYHDHFPGLQRTVGAIGADGSLTWSRPELVLDEQKARHLLCLDMRKGVEVCEFDGKLSATNYRGNTYIFGRANVAGERDLSDSAADSGGRHVQVTSHPIGNPSALEAFTSLHFDEYSTSKDNNIYFMAVMNLKDEVLVGLMPAIIDGVSGIFLSHSESGMLTLTRTLALALALALTQTLTQTLTLTLTLTQTLTLTLTLTRHALEQAAARDGVGGGRPAHARLPGGRLRPRGRQARLLRRPQHLPGARRRLRRAALHLLVRGGGRRLRETPRPQSRPRRRRRRHRRPGPGRSQGRAQGRDATRDRSARCGGGGGGGGGGGLGRALPARHPA